MNMNENVNENKSVNILDVEDKVLLRIEVSDTDNNGLLSSHLIMPATLFRKLDLEDEYPYGCVTKEVGDDLKHELGEEDIRVRYTAQPIGNVYKQNYGTSENIVIFNTNNRVIFSGALSYVSRYKTDKGNYVDSLVIERLKSIKGLTEDETKYLYLLTTGAYRIEFAGYLLTLEDNKQMLAEEELNLLVYNRKKIITQLTKNGGKKLNNALIEDVEEVYDFYIKHKDKYKENKTVLRWN